MIVRAWSSVKINGSAGSRGDGKKSAYQSSSTHPSDGKSSGCCGFHGTYTALRCEYLPGFDPSAAGASVAGAFQRRSCCPFGVTPYVSIVNRSSKTNIGELMLQYGGGGHENAGTCQVANDQAADVLQKLVKKINSDG